LRRHASYRGNAARKALEREAASLDDFLRGLGMTAESGPIDEQTLPRVTQLINKTNQFNLTTRRYTEEQVRAMARSPDWWCRWFKLSDRFGDHGLIGVMLAQNHSTRWRVDTWLMSCRILGRNMERYMCAALLSAARQAGAIEVEGEYRPSEKNNLVRDVYPRLGFQPLGDDSGRYVFNLRTQAIPDCECIEDRSARDVRGVETSMKRSAA